MFKRCKYCGSSDIRFIGTYSIYSHDYSYGVECQKCKNSVGPYITKDIAYKVWNEEQIKEIE